MAGAAGCIVTPRVFAPVEIDGRIVGPRLVFRVAYGVYVGSEALCSILLQVAGVIKH